MEETDWTSRQWGTHDAYSTRMFAYDIHSSRRRIDVHVGAQTSGTELLEGMEALLADPAFDPTYGILIDLRELERAPSVPELAELAQFVRTHAVAPDARRAFVTTSPVFLGIAQLFTRLARAAGSRYRVFRSPVDAEAWLNAGGGDALGAGDGELAATEPSSTIGHAPRLR